MDLFCKIFIVNGLFLEEGHLVIHEDLFRRVLFEEQFVNYPLFLKREEVYRRNIRYLGRAKLCADERDPVRNYS